ncbi:hypothetical protein ACFL2Q_00785 [Thermodesulfobacteriota bacterium]
MGSLRSVRREKDSCLCLTCNKCGECLGEETYEKREASCRHCEDNYRCLQLRARPVQAEDESFVDVEIAQRNKAPWRKIIWGVSPKHDNPIMEWLWNGD